MVCLFAATCIPATTAPAQTPCSTLKHRAIPAAQIGLPTRGARVTSARETNSKDTPFCRLRGEILSLDPTADPIRFELNLPDAWNNKAVQFGGASFDGHLQTALGAGPLGNRHDPTPLQRGYATFGSDSGHHHRYLFLPDIANDLRGNFARNDEERKNFGGDQIKKTHDAALAILRARYNTAPQRTFFLGGSTGGREAMVAVDRFPADYDGVLAAYPAWDQIETDLQFVDIARNLYAPSHNGQSGWLSRSDTRLLHNAVLQACDAADGLRDGIVSDPSACHFDPSTLACPGDSKSHHNCLTPAQLRTVHAIASDFTTSFSVSNGMTSSPGYNILAGANFTDSLGLTHHTFGRAIPILNGFYYVISDEILHHFLTGDPHLNTFTFNPRTGSSPGHPEGYWQTQIQRNSAEDDASLADLTPFATHGGKLLIVHGDSDTVIPTRSSILLDQRITAAMGPQTADTFLRLYLVPGFGHGRGAYNASFEALTTLDTWTNNNNTPPANLVVADRHHDRTRPLCAYPTFPRYIGGDPNSAASFTCASSQ